MTANPAAADDRPTDSASLLSVVEDMIAELHGADPQLPVARNYELSALTLGAQYATFNRDNGLSKQMLITAYLLGHTDASAEVARLRRENVALGDRNVLLATEMDAICTTSEEALGEWLGIEVPYLPAHLAPIHEIYGVAVEAMATNELAAHLESLAHAPVAEKIDRHELIDNGAEHDEHGYIWS